MILGFSSTEDYQTCYGLLRIGLRLVNYLNYFTDIGNECLPAIANNGSIKGSDEEVPWLSSSNFFLYLIPVVVSAKRMNVVFAADVSVVGQNVLPGLR